MPGKQFLRIIIGVLAMLAVTFMLGGSAGAQSKYETLYRFRGGTNGSGPSGLVIDAAGNLYGTTSSGGTFGYGTVFRLDMAGKKTVLHNFAGAPDGANPHPYAALILDGQGNLYGTTYVGGEGNQAGGTVFKLDTAGVETVLHNFCYGFPCTDGESPTAGLLLDDAGNLYGTTSLGGDDYEGTVFKLTPDGHGGWSETIQHAFDWLDGGSVYAGLVKDSANNLYGATAAGGAYSWGTVFKMDSAGVETILYNFIGTNGTDGAMPYNPPIFDAAGNLYGTAAYGGNPSCPGPFGNGCGTVWKLDTSGSLRVLHTFTGGKDGSSPLSGLIFDQAENLYGMTSGGGIYGYGVVFQMKPKPSGGWTYRVIHAFRNRPGAYPCSNLIMDAAGVLYGTTQGDGLTTFGSVFKIKP